MRFDLEIPNTNIDLMFIPEGMAIPNGAISTCYVEVDSRDAIPSKMLTMDENVFKNPFSGYSALAVAGPSFIVNSDKFLITHISKYISSLNAKVPLFYRVTINSKVAEDGIKIYDYYGVPLSEDNYLVEQSSFKNGNTYTDITYVYLNKQDRIMFLEYADASGVSKQLLSLEPIFTEASWDDITSGGALPQYKYTIAGGTVDTSHNGVLYIKYAYETGLIRLPVGNIEDPWYVGILNTTFSVNNAGGKFDYGVPEYYIQNAYKSTKFRNFLHVKCIKIMDGFVQLQAAPAKEKMNAITVYIEDYYTGALKKVFTSNKDLQSRNYSGTNLSYEAILDMSYDGVIKLPMTLGQNDIAYADFSTDDQYYEFRLVDFSTSLLSHSGYFGLYILPNVADNVSAIYIANIGQIDTRTYVEKLGAQGAGFSSMEDYYAFCAFHQAYHLATIGVSSGQQAGLVKIHDARRLGGDIADRHAICLDSSDMFYKDLIDKNVILPINDSVLAVFDSGRLSNLGMFNIDESSYTIDSKSKLIVDRVFKTIQENLDVSTNVVFELRKNAYIPPAKFTLVVNGVISSVAYMTTTDTTQV